MTFDFKTKSDAIPTPDRPDSALPVLEASAPTMASVPASTYSTSSTLDQISCGGIVRVVAVAGEDAIARRLGELGVRRGIEIEVMQRAPLGDPTLYELCGYQLCLRRTESARIRVEPAPASDSNSTQRR